MIDIKELPNKWQPLTDAIVIGPKTGFVVKIAPELYFTIKQPPNRIKRCLAAFFLGINYYEHIDNCTKLSIEPISFNFVQNYIKKI